MRNRISILRELPGKDFAPTVQVFDIGRVLAHAYRDNADRFLDEIRIDSASFFSDAISSQLKPSTQTILFTNIGILQEHDFDLNVPKFFLDFATSYRVCIYWPYQVVDNRKLIFSQEFASEAIVFNPSTLEMESL